MECPNCPGAHFKDLITHQRMARCGEASVPAETQLQLEGKPMADCERVDCGFTKRDLVDRDKEIAALKAKTPESQAPNLATALTHAQQGACPDCVGTLQTFTKDLVAKAITEISDDALRGLAIERGVIPTEITIEVPQGAVHHG